MTKFTKCKFGMGSRYYGGGTQKRTCFNQRVLVLGVEKRPCTHVSDWNGREGAVIRTRGRGGNTVSEPSVLG